MRWTYLICLKLRSSHDYANSHTAAAPSAHCAVASMHLTAGRLDVHFPCTQHPSVRPRADTRPIFLFAAQDTGDLLEFSHSHRNCVCASRCACVTVASCQRWPTFPRLILRWSLKRVLAGWKPPEPETFLFCGVSEAVLSHPGPSAVAGWQLEVSGGGFASHPSAFLISELIVVDIICF